MMLLVGTSTVFPSLVLIQETFGSDTIICPIRVLPSNNRMILCLMEVGGPPGAVCCREGVICGVAEETTRARTTLFPRHAGQTDVPVPLQTLHKTVALPPHVGHLPIFSGVPFRISMTSPTWSLVQACHPLLPVYFCQSSLGSWPGTSMCSHLPTESFIHFPGQSTCPFLHLEALHTIAPVPSHFRHFTRGAPEASTVGSLPDSPFARIPAELCPKYQ
jgi:hypothetical protein